MSSEEFIHYSSSSSSNNSISEDEISDFNSIQSSSDDECVCTVSSEEPMNESSWFFHLEEK